MPKLQRNGYQLHYVDYGKGQPVVLVHGWPLSHQSWETQIDALVDGGFRVIAYDRKGFGKSDAPWDGYDYDGLAEDLKALVDHLDIYDAVLVGFSMGGGEVVRYLYRFGHERIAKIALVSSIIPLVGQKSNNPKGVPQAKLQEIRQALEVDRFAFLKDFHRDFYQGSSGHQVSQAQMDFDFMVASQASARATVQCANAWATTDFRYECDDIKVPTLIIHGSGDQTVPIETSAEQAHRLIPNSVLKVYPGAPHGLNVTHATQLNIDLLLFLNNSK